MRIAVGFDHGGFALRDPLIAHLAGAGHEVVDCGAYQFDANDDFPDFCSAVAVAIGEGRADRGIVVCGSGVGAAIACCKHDGIRAAICHDHYSAHQGVEHDAMNVLCLGGRVIGVEPALEIVAAFISAEFDPQERFLRRIAKVDAIESD